MRNAQCGSIQYVLSEVPLATARETMDHLLYNLHFSDISVNSSSVSVVCLSSCVIKYNDDNDVCEE